MSSPLQNTAVPAGAAAAPTSGGRRRRVADLAFALFCLAVATAFWLEAGKLPASPFDPLGPGAVPRLVSGLLAALALLLLARLALGLRIGSAAQSFIVGMGADTPSTHRRRPWLAITGYAMTVAYVAVMHLDLLNFLWATMLYLAALGLLLLPPTRQARLTALAIAVVGALALQYVFSQILFVDLP